MTSAFVAELARRLQGQSAALALPLTWIEQRLAEIGLTHRAAGAGREPAAGRRPGLDQQQHRQPALLGVDRLAGVRRDAERRRADAARGSGRRLRAHGFRHPRPLPPRVEKIARQQPAARRCEVARKAIRLAQAAARRDGDDERAAHVGYYLIDKGLPELEQAVAHAPDAVRQVLQRIGAAPLCALSRRDRHADRALRRRACVRHAQCTRHARLAACAAARCSSLLAASQLAVGAGQLAGDACW